MSSEEQTKKPEDSDFQQQRLKAWQPLLTPKWVIGTFILIGIVFIPIGVAIVVSSGKVVEVEMRYDNLGYDRTNSQVNPNYPGGYPPTCDTYLTPTACSSGSTSCKLAKIDYPNPYLTGATAPDSSAVGNCMIPITITIPEDMSGPVYMYYKLSNFFQNHRRYVKSRSDTQLANAASVDTSTCDPWSHDATNLPYYPCGLIAGSFFTDRFSISVARGGNVQFTANWDDPASNPLFQKDGIAWSSDKSQKFKPNADTYKSPTTNFKGILGAQLPAIDDEDFIVWMRTAGLPTFKKLYRKINYDLKAGDVITVNTLNHYPVHDFSGQKAIVFSTTSWLGGKNSFLGWAYIVVGIICIALAIVFAIKHAVSPRPLGDMKSFHWPAQPVRQ